MPLSHVAVMQATNFENRDDGTERWQVDRPAVRCVLVQREMTMSADARPRVEPCPEPVHLGRRVAQLREAEAPR